ncbi:protein NRT1/ PTR FAMILY 3.1 isoform X1 [Arachis duranensis]|uniref:Protein NRT1/ PTR FAMILY 3.1 isoform X1 n=2 Tax=Arachis duranensis TaxID=130453 RepID=A0A6P4DQJ8_ARADU|nr:protein NRT1/ PTR FAMILY 3.1 isoform X1 [Arachis duranensis]
MVVEKSDEVLEEQKRKQHNERKHNQHGGMKTAPFILANEVCDKFASIGFNANLMSYLTQELHMATVTASNTLINFDGAANLAPLLGAVIAETFAGTFWTIILGSILCELGLIIITISASMHSPACHEATSSQLRPLYLSLLLIAFGSGCIRPCVVPFLGDQFDMTKKGVASRKWNLFNLYTFSMGLAPLTALTVVVYVQENMGWSWGLGIPTIARLIAIFAFVMGSSFYRKVKPQGCSLIRLVQVLVAAIRKRKEVLPDDPKLLYENKELDAPISLQGRLLHTYQFRWLDKAATVTKEESNIKDTKEAPKLWSLATVHRVEELKSILRLVPICLSTILHVASVSSNQNFLIQQARSMDRRITSSFQIPPATMFVFSVMTMMIGVILYEHHFVPFASRLTKNPSGLTCLQRMGIGYGISIIATIVSSLIEIKRKNVATKYNMLDSPKAIIPISVFWLLPQICLHGLVKVFMSGGHLEFLYDQSPESMRSTTIALFSIFISIGNYCSTMMVSFVHRFSGNDESNWLPNRNLNKGRLEYYYLLVSVVQVINLIYYVIVACFYTYKPVEEISSVMMNGKEDLQQGKEKIFVLESGCTMEDQNMILTVQR